MKLRDAALWVAFAACLLVFGLIGISVWWLITELINMVLAVMWIVVTEGGA